MSRLLLLCAMCGCSRSAAGDLGVIDLSVYDQIVLPGDSDADGITDDEEARLAHAYLPFLSPATDDACGTSGLIVRVTPTQPSPLVALRYLWLFDRSCDGAVIAGDGGAFTVIIDPRVPAPAGLISLRAIARPETGCQRLSTCGQCPGQPACAALAGSPAVWAARDRHAIYVNRPLSCTQTPSCAVVCEDASTTATPPIVEVGEPSASRIHDLTDAGFIRPELGWQSASLLHYDPWGSQAFGSLPSLRSLLEDPVGDAPGCLP